MALTVRDNAQQSPSERREIMRSQIKVARHTVRSRPVTCSVPAYGAHLERIADVPDRLSVILKALP